MGATACFLGSELPIYMVSRQSRGGCLLTCHRGFAVVAIFSHACISLQFVFCLHVPKRISEWEDLWIANATSMSHAGGRLPVCQLSPPEEGQHCSRGRRNVLARARLSSAQCMQMLMLRLPCHCMHHFAWYQWDTAEGTMTVHIHRGSPPQGTSACKDFHGQADDITGDIVPKAACSAESPAPQSTSQDR